MVAALTASVLVLTACSGGGEVLGTSSSSVATTDGQSNSEPGGGAPTTQSPSQTPGATPDPSTSPSTGDPSTPDPSTPDPSATSSSGAAPASLGLPTPDEITTAREDVSDLTDRELVGQLIVASYQGTDAGAAADLVREHHLAGVITLGANVPEAVDSRVPLLTELTGAVQDAVTDSGRDWPAFLGIDQEGGPITRVGAPLDHWPAAMALGAARDPELTQEVTQASGEQLRALGYTVVFAPSADTTIGPQDPTIGARSPGSDPELVAQTAIAELAGFADAGILPVAKHFPGHGSITTDSHLGVAEQTADLATLQERDLVPFRAVIDAGAPAMMPGHIVVDAIDPGQPATLSSAVLTGLLQEDLGFTGLVVTDALNMGAITEASGDQHPAVSALLAGVDVLLMPPDPIGSLDAVVAALADGTLDRADLEDSAARVVATLRHQQQVPAPGASVIGSAHDLSVRAAAAGLTQLTGACGERLVGDSITISGGTETDRANLAEAAQEAGLGTGSGDSVVLVGGSTYQAGGGAGGPGTGSGDIVVTTDRPYPLADSSASTALIAAYGRDPATMEALVQVLLGETTAPGALPTPVGDHPIGSGCGH
nr:glycoside hydrolase family 3 N-terminal domain-containing protein [Ornithinimicrobium sp. HY1793]